MTRGVRASRLPSDTPNTTQHLAHPADDRACMCVPGSLPSNVTSVCRCDTGFAPSADGLRCVRPWELPGALLPCGNGSTLVTQNARGALTAGPDNGVSCAWLLGSAGAQTALFSVSVDIDPTFAFVTVYGARGSSTIHQRARISRRSARFSRLSQQQRRADASLLAAIVVHTFFSQTDSPRTPQPWSGTRAGTPELRRRCSPPQPRGSTAPRDSSMFSTTQARRALRYPCASVVSLLRRVVCSGFEL